MIPEHDRVVLIADVPTYGLKAGDVGVVVHVYADNAAYEIEFFSVDGNTVEVVTIEADQVRPVTRRDMMHVRVLPEGV